MVCIKVRSCKTKNWKRKNRIDTNRFRAYNGFRFVGIGRIKCEGTVKNMTQFHISKIGDLHVNCECYGENCKINIAGATRSTR